MLHYYVSLCIIIIIIIIVAVVIIAFSGFLWLAQCAWKTINTLFIDSALVELLFLYNYFEEKTSM